MRGLILSLGLGVALSLSMFGCATGGVTVYPADSTGKISNVIYGHIIQADNVVLSDTGGATAGNQVARYGGQLLVVRLDTGGDITFTQKGRQYRVGDRVALTVQGNKVTQVRFVTR